ncbi:hypothetical protein BBJ28_00021778 [Nothophytophthora sp. Chile5]|nr:hypothetical protein BBJ28_00021778 [Nothophytophthora sp. Chile5]
MASEGPQRRYVRASDRRLAEVAGQAAARINLEGLQPRQRPDIFTISSKRVLDSTVVTASCLVECSTAEMHALLAPPTSERYACVMRELLGQDFIYGAIVHHAADLQPLDVTVKTATFAKRHVLGRSEQWCYVSAAQSLDFGEDGQGFSVTLASLHPDDVFTGKAQAASVTHLQGITAVYIVAPELPTHDTKQQSKKAKRAVRVTFCAHVPTSAVASSRPSRLRRFLTSSKTREEVDDASSGVVLARATQLARALQQLGAMVRRRRLDAQVLADLRQVRPNNSRCVCCTRRIDFIRNMFGGSRHGDEDSNQEDSATWGGSRRCRLCGFLVCSRCVASVDMHSLPVPAMDTPMKNAADSSRVVHLCEHCMQRVDDADYDNCSADYGGRSMATTTRTTAVQPDAPDAESATAALARGLSEMLGSASAEQKPAVIRVIRHVLDRSSSQREKRQTTRESRAESIGLSSSLGPLVSEGACLEALRRLPHVTVKQAAVEAQEDSMKPMEAFAYQENRQHADATGRNYPLQRRATSNNDDIMSDGMAGFPIPIDEDRRVECVERRSDLVSQMMNLPELVLFCELACRELRCDAALVTLIGSTSAHIVASSDATWRECIIPRDQSVCTHAIMNEAPLLVPHPEADVRFSSMNVVQRRGLRFYFGFPIGTSDKESGQVIRLGTFCCVHADSSRTVSQAQYALMATLAAGVSRLMEHYASRVSTLAN